MAAEISRLIRTEPLDNGSAIQPKDIAILVRDKKHGKGVTKALQALGVPVASDSAMDPMHDPRLIDLLNLLRVIDNPYRDLPLSAFLVSPLGGFDLDEVANLRAAASENVALFETLALYAQDEQSEPYLKQKTAELLAWLDQWRAQAVVLSADRFLRLLYLDERLVEESSEAPYLMLYEQARLYQRTAFCGLYGFLQHVDRLIDGKKISAAGFAKAENAVTVMTIHHSKGLEFPVVFLISCGSLFNDMDARETLVFHPRTGAGTKLYQRDTANHESTALREATVMAIRQDQHEESIRTLYVALTRARERLYVTGTLNGKWENATVTAHYVRRANRTAILSSGSFLSWMLAVRAEYLREKREFPCIFHHFSLDDDLSGVPLMETDDPKINIARTTDDTARYYADVLHCASSFAYPLEALRGLPTKAAASKLSDTLLDHLLAEDSDDALEAQIQLMSSTPPGFDRMLETRKQATAAEIGTATHAFLEFCNFSQLYQSGVDAELDRMVAQGFLHSETAAIVRKDQLEAFRTSGLMQAILSAKRVWREQKISMFVPLSSLTANQKLANELEGHSLYVQGSIDLLLETAEGQLLLVDYKTDRISDAEREDRALLQKRMKRVHSTQLSCYATAVQGLFGKQPDRLLLYSLPLGDTLEIS